MGSLIISGGLGQFGGRYLLTIGGIPYYSLGLNARAHEHGGGHS